MLGYGRTSPSNAEQRAEKTRNCIIKVTLDFAEHLTRQVADSSGEAKYSDESTALDMAMYKLVYRTTSTPIIAPKDHQSVPVETVSIRQVRSIDSDTHLVAWYVPATFRNELRYSLVDVWSCSNDLVLKLNLASPIT